MSKIIAVVNQKGGVGKTSTAVNLAAALADAGKKILLIDLDPQGNATTSFGISKTGESVYQLLAEECSVQEAVRIPYPPYPHVIPASSDLSAAEVELVGEIGREFRLKEVLADQVQDYDVVLIDCPPSLSLLTINALVAADGLLVPFQCEFLAMEGIAQLQKTLSIIRQRLNPKLAILGVLFTMYDGRSNLVKNVAQEIREFFREAVFTTLIPRNIQISEAQSMGKPVLWYAKRAKSSLAFQKLEKEFSYRLGATDWQVNKL
ncbi:MAG: ParA family protein [Magnetococcales bacterium]|nr:ParA family protein [Magnetococcales bacterium]